MRVKLVNVGIGVGAGVLDELGEKFDADRANTKAFTGITDWGRVGVAAVGYLGQMMNFQPSLSEAVAMSATPLATKTVVKAIMQSMKTGVAAQPRVTRSMDRAGGKVSWRPVAIH